MIYIKKYENYKYEFLNENLITKLIKSHIISKKQKQTISDLSSKLDDIKIDLEHAYNNKTEKNKTEKNKIKIDKLIDKKAIIQKDIRNAKKTADEADAFINNFFKLILIVGGTMVVIGGIGGALRALTVYLDLKWKDEVEKTRYILRDPDNPDWKKRDKDHKFVKPEDDPDYLNYKKNNIDIQIIDKAVQQMNVNENIFVDAIDQYIIKKNAKSIIPLFEKIFNDKQINILVDNISQKRNINSAKSDMIKLNNYINKKYGKPDRQSLIKIGKNLPKIIKELKKIIYGK